MKTKFIVEEVFKNEDIDERIKKLEELLYLIILKSEFRSR